MYCLVFVQATGTDVTEPNWAQFVYINDQIANTAHGFELVLVHENCICLAHEGVLCMLTGPNCGF